MTSTTVREVRPPGRPPADGVRVGLLVSTPDGQETWRARIVVGADGPGSLVARAFGVQRAARRLRRAGITFHLDVADAPPEDARMVIGPGWYCGICPVPGGRVNVGIVVGERPLRHALARGQRPADVARRILGELPKPWNAIADRPATDEVAIALPLANRVARLSGPGFVLVGDAAGFIDPISGEGLHRALVSADLAAEGIRAALAGRSAIEAAGLGQGATDGALADYDRRLRARFRQKDLISWLIQAFMARPELLGYAIRRLGSRPGLRDTFAAVMADLEPADRALQPRFLARLLRP